METIDLPSAIGREVLGGLPQPPGAGRARRGKRGECSPHYRACVQAALADAVDTVVSPKIVAQRTGLDVRDVHREMVKLTQEKRLRQISGGLYVQSDLTNRNLFRKLKRDGCPLYQRGYNRVRANLQKLLRAPCAKAEILKLYDVMLTPTVFADMRRNGEITRIRTPEGDVWRLAASYVRKPTGTRRRRNSSDQERLQCD